MFKSVQIYRNPFMWFAPAGLARGLISVSGIAPNVETKLNVPDRVPERTLQRIRKVAEAADIDISNIDMLFDSLPVDRGTACLDIDVILLDYEYLNEGREEELEYTMFHELRHFDQYRKGFFNVIDGKFFWNGNLYGKNEFPSYYVRPWEIDANAYAISKTTPAGREKNKIFQRILNAMTEHDAKFELTF